MTEKKIESSATALIATAVKEPARMEKALATTSKASRYLRSLLSREYPVAPWRSLALGFVTLAYLVNPLDLIPDAILVLGWLDDMTLMGLWLASMRKDIAGFAAWEKETVRGD